MKNNLQQIIDEINKEITHDINFIEQSEKRNHNINKDYVNGKIYAFSLCLEKITEILNLDD